jgi:hypothetical protein
MGEKFVAVNAKYYKNSQTSGELGHVNRVFNENKNAIENLTKYNFGSDTENLKQKYDGIISKFEKIKGKKFQKNSNTMVDCVVAFNRDGIRELKENFPDTWDEKIKNSLADYQKLVSEKHGFYPVGFEFHCDEGHYDANGDFQENFHAHAIFVNYNPKTKTAPLRKMEKNDWSNLQDLAGQSFKNLGFSRGISKTETKQKHLEKEEFIAEKLSVAENVIEKLKDVIQEQRAEIAENSTFLGKLENAIKEQYKNFLKSGLNFIDKYRSKSPEQIKNANSNINKKANMVAVSPELDEIVDKHFDEMAKKSDGNLKREKPKKSKSDGLKNP